MKSRRRHALYDGDRRRRPMEFTITMANMAPISIFHIECRRIGFLSILFLNTNMPACRGGPNEVESSGEIIAQYSLESRCAPSSHTNFFQRQFLKQKTCSQRFMRAGSPRLGKISEVVRLENFYWKRRNSSTSTRTLVSC